MVTPAQRRRQAKKEARARAQAEANHAAAAAHAAALDAHLDAYLRERVVCCTCGLEQAYVLTSWHDAEQGLVVPCQGPLGLICTGTLCDPLDTFERNEEGVTVDRIAGGRAMAA